jgi:site-specific DNA-cytosine methylase
MRSLNVAGICSGIGGFELGLQSAGHEIIYMNVVNYECRKVLARQFPGVRITSDLLAQSGLPPGIEVLCMGLPCQAFSVRNTHRKEEFEGSVSETACLIKQACRLLQNQRVPIVLLENTPAILATRRDGVPFRHLCFSMRALGYSVAYRVVHSAAWGLPQGWRHLLAVFRLYGDPRDDLLVSVSPCAYGKRRGCICYLSKDAESLSPAAYCTDLGENSSYTRFNISPTITASCANRLLVWAEDVGTFLLKSRQLLQLQGFPAGWLADLDILETTALRMVGNSMPPPMSAWLGRELARDIPLKYNEPEPDISQGEAGSFSSAGWSLASESFRTSTRLQVLGTRADESQVRLSEFPEHFDFGSLHYAVTSSPFDKRARDSEIIRNWLRRLQRPPPQQVLLVWSVTFRSLIRTLKFRSPAIGEMFLKASRGSGTLTAPPPKGGKKRKSTRPTGPRIEMSDQPGDGGVLGEVNQCSRMRREESAEDLQPSGRPGRPGGSLSFALTTGERGAALAFEGRRGTSEPYHGVCSLGMFMTEHLRISNGSAVRIQDLFTAYSRWYKQEAGERFDPPFDLSDIT